MVEIIIDREREINMIESGIRVGLKILLKGLRGVGKTTLLKYFVEKYNGLYVNCQKILRPEHLLEIIGNEGNYVDAYEALEKFFEIACNKYYLIALDEFTDLLVRLGNFKPYRGTGGTSAVASHLRAILEEVKKPIIFSTTSIKTLYDVAGEYSKPLARSFDMIIHVHPLSMEDALKLIDKLCSEKGIKCTYDAKLRIAEMSGGNPAYIKAIINGLRGEKIDINSVNETVNALLREGYFNLLFQGIEREISISELEVLYIISRGYTRYSEIERRGRGININQALSLLIQRGFITKIKINRESHYVINDKTMALWLATEPYPGLEALSFETARIMHAAFESLVRELFMQIQKTIEVKDITGKKLLIYPVKKVYRYKGKLGEIDAIIVTKQGTIVCEIYFGEKCPPEKIQQLERNVAIAEKMGENIYAAALISYFGFQNETIERAKQSPAMQIIYLLDKNSLWQISKAIGYRLL